MAREILVDEDTVLGYSYPLEKFYVTNKGTNAYRLTKEDIKALIDIVAPTNTITIEQITSLKETYEALNSLSYTLADNGSCITTIQLNTYKENPITLDLLKKKLYVMNSNLIFDLEVNEAPSYRVDYLISYYKNTHGLLLTYDEMLLIYNLLIKYYNPVIYNNITLQQEDTTTTTPLYYSNKFTCYNYTEKSTRLNYSVTANPNNSFLTYYLVSTDADNKKVTLTNSPSPTLNRGDKITLLGSTYTVQSQSFRIVTVKETTLPTYTFPYRKAYSITAQTNISSISRDTKTITLAETPTGIAIGDTIEVTGTTTYISQDLQETADGIYTVSSITGTDIVVEETPQVNYTDTTGAYPQVFKRTLLGNITSIEDSVATLQSSITPLTPNTQVQIVEQDNSPIGTYICTASTGTKLTLTNSPNYTPVYNEVKVPSMNMLVDVTYSNSERFPVGEFIVDTFEQAVEYISTYINIPTEYIPTPTIQNNLYVPVPTSISLEIPIGNVSTMNLLGLYSKVYKG